MDKRMRFFAWLIGQLERRRMTYDLTSSLFCAIT